MFNPKVLHENMSNNIIQMRSGGFQPPFIAGGNQVAFYLGIKGNSGTTPMPTGEYSTFERIIKEHKQK
jgi:hypothetical protein